MEMQLYKKICQYHKVFAGTKTDWRLNNLFLSVVTKNIAYNSYASSKKICFPSRQVLGTTGLIETSYLHLIGKLYFLSTGAHSVVQGNEKSTNDICNKPCGYKYNEDNVVNNKVQGSVLNNEDCAAYSKSSITINNLGNKLKQEGIHKRAFSEDKNNPDICRNVQEILILQKREKDKKIVDELVNKRLGKISFKRKAEGIPIPLYDGPLWFKYWSRKKRPGGRN